MISFDDVKAAVHKLSDELPKGMEDTSFGERADAQTKAVGVEPGAVAALIVTMLGVLTQLEDELGPIFQASGEYFGGVEGYTGPEFEWTSEKLHLAYGLMQGLFIGILCGREDEDNGWWAEDGALN